MVGHEANKMLISEEMGRRDRDESAWVYLRGLRSRTRAIAREELIIGLSAGDRGAVLVYFHARLLEAYS